MFTTLLLVAVVGAQADQVNMKFVESGVTEKLGSYRPMQAKMEGKADLVKKAPEGLKAPKYGTIAIGDKTWAFILDEPAEGTPKFYVDTNGDGDLTNDPETTWMANKQGELTMYNGKAQVDLASGQRGALGVYRFDPNDKRRAALANTLLYYTDFGYEVTINLDGKPYTSFISGKPDERNSFWIDRDGNQQQSYRLELVAVNRPFNFTGTTYVLKLDGDQLKLEKAAEELPQAPLPPDLAVGKPAPAFTATTLDGQQIDFPKSFAGKIVMLDFWATWCGPCIAELPNVTKAYKDWHDKGFEIIGISFDQADMDEKLKEFTKEREMEWQHIYEGKYWNTTIGQQYDVSAIPFVLLVDGDSGNILATVRDLRGPGLSEFVGKAIEKKSETGK